jgi:hypothetical protein
MLNSAGEAPGGVSTGSLSVDSPVAGEVHKGKEQVSQLSGEGGAATFSLANLFYLLPDLGWDAFLWIWPIKSDPRGTFLQILGKEKRGKM